MSSPFARLLLFDPGYVRLKTAVRGTIAVLLSFSFSSQLATAVQSSSSLPFLGAIVAMMGAVALVDLKRSEETFALLFMSVPAILAVSLSIGLTDWPKARIGIFLVVSFLAVALRRFGGGWSGIGLVMFMAFFASLFFPFHLADLPWAALAILGSALITYVCRFWLLPDRPRWVLRQLIAAFALREQRMLQVIRECLQDAQDQRLQLPPVGLPGLWLPVRASFIQLNELALTIEQFFERTETQSIRSSSSAFQLALFEREFLLRRLWDASSGLFRRHQDTAFRERVLAALRDLRAPTALEGQPEASDFLRARWRLASALETLAGGGDAPELVEEPKPSPAVASSGRLHISTRQAIQATVATALASLIGNSVSSQRWYWASISAFIVFIGASRGDTTIRATLRILGTVVGLVLGFFLATIVAEKSAWEWTLVMSSIFLAIYASRLNFGFWSAMLFSSMFALLYDRLGLMTRDILVLRVEETLIGAVMGVLVASILLPTSTHQVVREAVIQYLRTVVTILVELQKNLANAFSRRALIRLLRTMDRDLMNLRQMASPIVGHGSLMKRGGIPGLLHDSTAMGHFLRHLALHVEPQAGKPEFTAACEQLIRELEEAIQLLAGPQVPPQWGQEFAGVDELEPSARHYMKCLRLTLVSMANRKI